MCNESTDWLGGTLTDGGHVHTCSRGDYTYCTHSTKMLPKIFLYLKKCRNKVLLKFIRHLKESFQGVTDKLLPALNAVARWAGSQVSRRQRVMGQLFLSPGWWFVISFWTDSAHVRFVPNSSICRLHQVNVLLGIMTEVLAGRRVCSDVLHNFWERDVTDKSTICIESPSLRCMIFFSVYTYKIFVEYSSLISWFETVGS